MHCRSQSTNLVTLGKGKIMRVYECYKTIMLIIVLFTDFLYLRTIIILYLLLQIAPLALAIGLIVLISLSSH